MDRDIGTMLRQVAAATLRMDDRFTGVWNRSARNSVPATVSIAASVSTLLRHLPAAASRTF